MRFDVDSFVGSPSSGDSAVFMLVRLVPVSMLSRRLSVDDEPQDLDEHILVIKHFYAPIPFSRGLSMPIALLNLLRML